MKNEHPVFDQDKRDYAKSMHSFHNALSGIKYLRKPKFISLKSLVLFSGLLLLTSLLSAQDFITYSGNGKVVLLEGKTLEGNVVYSLPHPGIVGIKVANERSEKFKANEVKEFYLDDKHYVSVQTKGGINLSVGLTFAVILNSENSKIRLYKIETQPIISSGSQVPVTTTYHCGLPDGGNVIYPLSHSSVCPSKKLVAYFQDCPELIKKINDKADGYSYGLIGNDVNRLDVLERINNEYASCKP